MNRFTFAALACTFLTGCIQPKEQQLAQCKLDAFNQHIRDSDTFYYVTACMGSHGYKLDMNARNLTNEADAYYWQPLS